MNLQHLKLFVDEEKFPFYMLYFRGAGKVDVIATNGYSMLVNTIPAMHNLDDIVMGIDLMDIGKIMIFSGAMISFRLWKGELFIDCDQASLPLSIISSNLLPNVKNIFSLQAKRRITKASFLVSNLKMITKYCDLIGDDQLTHDFYGIDKPVVYSGKGWKIYMMPLEFKNVT